jgi:hypothetical protein
VNGIELLGKPLMYQDDLVYFRVREDSIGLQKDGMPLVINLGYKARRIIRMSSSPSDDQVLSIIVGRGQPSKAIRMLDMGYE